MTKEQLDALLHYIETRIEYRLTHKVEKMQVNHKAMDDLYRAFAEYADDGK